MRAIKIAACIILIGGCCGAPVWAAGEEQQSPIASGTVITTQNWQNYQQYMTDGMKALFAGTYFWKFPADFQMVVGQPRHYPFPPVYAEYTKKYASQVQIVNLPDGRHSIRNYVAGMPFPNPTEPLKAWKLLVDDWFAYTPHIECNDSSGFTFMDRFGNITRNTWWFIERLGGHIAEPGLPIFDPKAPGVYWTEWFQIMSPEEAKYTALFTVYYRPMERQEDSFLFIPALRRSLRLSTAARCAPALGSDFVNDDTRHGAFNGNASRFDASMLPDRAILEMPDPDNKLSGEEANFYLPLFFPKPNVGKWEVRDSWVIDVRRVASQAAGYCYGKRILYCDKESYQSIWAELYDDDMKLWKIDYDPQGLVKVPGVGAYWTNDGWGVMIDIQNNHLTRVHLSGGGRGMQGNDNCKNVGNQDFTDQVRYGSVAGLSEIMR